MKEKKIEGISESGVIQEALNNAISIAKETLQTDLISWKLDEIYGEDGGVIEKHFISVKIIVQSPNL